MRIPCLILCSPSDKCLLSRISIAPHLIRIFVRPCHIAIINAYRMPVSKSYLQFGAGFSCPDSFDNYDASPTLFFERIPLIGKLYTKNAARFPRNTKYGDITSGLSVMPASYRGIYCSHVLEHLTVAGFRSALRNSHIYLKPNGILRLVMPDLESLCQIYLSDTSERASFELQTKLYLRREVPRAGLRGFLADWLGHDAHRWLWDFESAAAELRDAGFINIRRAWFGDSEDRNFDAVEEKGRWDGCLGIEC